MNHFMFRILQGLTAIGLATNPNLDNRLSVIFLSGPHYVKNYVQLIKNKVR